ncbi:MAG TPA: hypothetical protein VGN01_14585 [Acidobacteriaceae bacterium]|jgi:hypothetical protein
MKHSHWTSAVVMAGFLLISGAIQAQTDGMGGRPAGQGRGQRGGFGGGQMGQPVQGTVTEATATKLTIKTDAGDSYEVTVTDTARVIRAGQAIKLSDVKPGDSVTARGTVDATKKTVQAMMVMDVDAETVAKAKENLGKTYVTGRIAAIDADNLKLTVKRTDGVSQIIAVDDGTSFQRGNSGVAADVAAAGGMSTGMGMGMRGGRRGAGAQAAPPAPESITLADIKVGDAVMATGSVKGGTFTVLKMGISEPGMMGAGRNRGAQGQAPPAGAGAPPAAPPQ